MKSGWGAAGSVGEQIRRRSNGTRGFWGPVPLTNAKLRHATSANRVEDHGTADEENISISNGPRSGGSSLNNRQETPAHEWSTRHRLGH